MARRIAAVLLLFAAPLVSAQTTTGNTITVNETNDQDRTININECSGAESDGISFTWTYSGFTIPGTYKLTVSDTSGCPSTGKNQVFDNISGSSANGAFPSSGTTPVSPLMTTLGLGACTASQSTVFLCVDFIPTGGGATVTSAVTGTIDLDFSKPPKPQITSVTPGDGALNISWTAGSGSSTDNTLATATRYTVVVTSHADPTKEVSKNVAGATSLRVGGLDNDQAYDVVVYGFSKGGNQSPASDTKQGTPIEIDDFWRLYQKAGGSEQGGCSTGAAGAVALLALVPFALRRRRRS